MEEGDGLTAFLLLRSSLANQLTGLENKGKGPGVGVSEKRLPALLFLDSRGRPQQLSEQSREPLGKFRTRAGGDTADLTPRHTPHPPSSDLSSWLALPSDLRPCGLAVFPQTGPA